MANIGPIRGVVKGMANYSLAAGERLFMPLPDLQTATLAVGGETLEIETFSDQGLLGLSSACPQSQSLTISFGTSDMSWSFMQASLLTRAVEKTTPTLAQFSKAVDANDVAAGETTVTLPSAPDTDAAGLAFNNLPVSGVAASDENGNQYITTVSGSDVTIAEDLTGVKVYFSYQRAAVTGEEMIEFGKGAGLNIGGLYGEFLTCDAQTILVVVPRASFTPTSSATVSSGSQAEFSIEAKALRGADGSYAQIVRVPG